MGSEKSSGVAIQAQDGLRSREAVPSSWKATPSQLHMSLCPSGLRTSAVLSPSPSPPCPLAHQLLLSQAGLLPVLCAPSLFPFSLHLLGSVSNRGLLKWTLPCSSRSGGEDTDIVADWLGLQAWHGGLLAVCPWTSGFASLSMVSPAMGRTLELGLGVIGR